MTKSINVRACRSVIEILDTFGPLVPGGFRTILGGTFETHEIPRPGGEKVTFTVKHGISNNEDNHEIWASARIGSVILLESQIVIPVPRSLSASLLAEGEDPQEILQRLIKLPDGISPRIHAWKCMDRATDSGSEHVLIGEYRQAYQKVITREYPI